LRGRVFLKARICHFPRIGYFFIFYGPLKAEMPAISAKCGHLVPHCVRCAWKFFSSQVILENTVYPSGNGAHVVAGRCQAQTAIRNDSATGGIIRESVEPSVGRRDIERFEKVFTGRLQCAFDNDISWDIFQYAMNLAAEIIRPENQPDFRIVIGPILSQPFDNVENPAVERRFAAQEPYSFPCHVFFHAFPYERINH